MVGGCLAEVQSYILVEMMAVVDHVVLLVLMVLVKGTWETLVPDDEELGVTDGGGRTGEGCLEGNWCGL